MTYSFLQENEIGMASIDDLLEDIAEADKLLAAAIKAEGRMSNDKFEAHEEYKQSIQGHLDACHDQLAVRRQGSSFEYLTLGEPLPKVTPCPGGRNDCPSGCGKCPIDTCEECDLPLLRTSEGQEICNCYSQRFDIEDSVPASATTGKLPATTTIQKGDAKP